MSSKFRLLLVPVFLLTLNLCLAEAPSGTVRFTAAELGVPVYDLSGGYSFQQNILADDTVLPLGLGFELSHSAKGKLTGAGTTIVSVGQDFLGAAYTASGRVTRNSSGVTEALITVRLEGEGVVAGDYTTFYIKLNYRLRVTIDGLTGKVTGKASFHQLGSGKVDSNVFADLPEGTNGEWELWMNLVPLSKLSGTGFVTLPAKQRTLYGDVKGSYKASTDLSKVSFKGTGDARGTSLNIRFFTVEGTHIIERIKGTILGQRVLIEPEASESPRLGWRSSSASI